MRRATRVGAACVAGASLFLSACYSYVPETVLAPDAGRRVHLTIQPSSMATIAPQYGPRVRDIVGVVQGRDSSEFRLSVVSLKTLDGFETITTNLPGTVPRSAIEFVEVERFSRGKTIAVVGLAAAALAIGVKQFALGGSSTTGAMGGQSPPAFRAP